MAIPATWPRIKDWIASAAEKSNGRYTEPLIRAYAERGMWQIWIAVEAGGDIAAVAGTKIIAYDTGLRTIFFLFGTGRGRKGWQDFEVDIRAWAMTQGCTLAEGCFRIGWRRIFRVFGWLHTHDFLERAL